MTEIDDAKELELLGSGDAGDLTAEVDENAILGDNASAASEKVETTTANGVKTEDGDLYDDAIAPSGQPQEKQDSRKSSAQNTSMASTTSSHSDKKYCCYIGNMTWWTTDADLLLNINSIGVRDVIEMKFFENRLTGQSKGYALCVFGSDQAVRTVTEKIPQKVIHGSTLCVLPYTKQSLARLEEAVAKTQTRVDPKAPKKDDGCLNMGTIRIGAGGIQKPAQPTMMMNRGGPGPQMQMGAPPGGNMMLRPPGVGMGGPVGGQMPMNNMNRGPGGPLPLMINGQPSMQQAPPMMRPPMSGPPGVGGGGAPGVPQQVQLNLPPGAPRPMMGAPQPMMSQPQPLMQMQTAPMQSVQMQQRPPGMPFGQPQPQPVMSAAGPQPLMQQQLRPPGMQPMGQGPPGQLPPPGAHVNPQVGGGQRIMFPGGMHPPGNAGIPDAEFEEIMNRNRTVSSSAISRAVSDASSGDVKAAVETLLTAISLIKQSRVAHDDRCRMLVASLQDTLNGIESKSYSSSSGSSRSKHRDRDRSRSRSRDRERKRRRRSRSSSRSRSPVRHRSSRHY